MDPNNLRQITTGFNNLYNDLKGIALAISIFFLGWAALMMLFAGHNERQQEQGRMLFFFCLIAMVLILLAPAIANIVFHAFGGTP